MTNWLFWASFPLAFLSYWLWEWRKHFNITQQLSNVKWTKVHVPLSGYTPTDTWPSCLCRPSKLCGVKVMLGSSVAVTRINKWLCIGNNLTINCGIEGFGFTFLVFCFLFLFSYSVLKEKKFENHWERAEMKRRSFLLLYYLLRTPFYDKFSEWVCFN